MRLTFRPASASFIIDSARLAASLIVSASLILRRSTNKAGRRTFVLSSGQSPGGGNAETSSRLTSLPDLGCAVPWCPGNGTGGRVNIAAAGSCSGAIAVDDIRGRVRQGEHVRRPSRDDANAA